MKKIDLIPGTDSDGTDTAFCPSKMAEQNIDDLGVDRIEEMECLAVSSRWGHADATPFGS